VVNKTTIDSDELARLTWGAAQLGIAQGVLDAVAEQLLEPAVVADLVLLVALWVDPEAHDETALRIANRAAVRAAIADALAPADVGALADRRDDAANAFYNGE
jgi:5,6,7,8-tetrahydromethanopterin hydro-lyase